MLYDKLAELYSELEKTSKNLDKTQLIADFLKKAPSKELKDIVFLIGGSVSPDYEEFEIGVGEKLVVKAIALSSGNTESKIMDAWKKMGDLGEVAEKFCKDKKQATLFSHELSVSDVFENLRKLPSHTGGGSVDKKIAILNQLLISASPLSAKYIVRTILGELRIGVGKGLIRDAIASAFGKSREEVENAYNLTTDFGTVAELASAGKLEVQEVTLGRPIQVMLYPKVNSVKEGFEETGSPAALEWKYDGFRVQIHKEGAKVKLFTRGLEEVTNRFPEVVNWAKKQVNANECVLDSEVIGIDPKTKGNRPFQEISQRIKRKYDIDEMVKDVPVQVNVFDIIYLNGNSLINTPFKERRATVEKIITPLAGKFLIAKQLVTDDLKKAEDFYENALKLGFEGVMMKSLSAGYTPGHRVGAGVKIKPVMEPLDLTIIGAEWGTGKRAGWLSSFELACRGRGEYLPIGKMGTGIKEKEEMGYSFKELTKELKGDIIGTSGKTVVIKPRVVIEVGYQEIQKSPTYASGYALRFPRLLRFREKADKPLSQIDDLKRIEELYKEQKKR